MSKSIPYILTVFLFVSFGCNHNTESFDGPSLVDRFGEFDLVAALEVSQPTVDFEAGETVYFTAQFNKNVDWVVVITGMESGAVKRIEGFDKEVGQENAIWDGGTTDLPFFKAEMCTVELVVPEEPDFLNIGEVTSLSTKTYNGSLFADWEEDPGVNVEAGNYEFELTPNSGRQNNIPAAQGEYYYLLEGTDNVVPNFFVGLANVSSKIAGETYASLPTTVPENLYFNCFLYSDGGPHGIAVIQFVFDSNDSGAFEDGSDLTFQVAGDFPLNWEGWQLISHPMSETGMTQEQLEKLVAIRLILISDMYSQPADPLQVKFGADFLTFTEGGPLEL